MLAVRQSFGMRVFVRVLAHGGLLAGGAFLYASILRGDVPVLDSVSYWSAWRVGLYSKPWPEPLTYVYPPPFAQAILPLTLLPLPLFILVWSGLLFAALVAAVGAATAGWGLVLLPFVLKDVSEGQIHSLLGLAIVLGYRWPAAWAFVLLTKVTPGIGLVWFAVRREWRNLAVAAAATAAVALMSFALAPDLWLRWVGTVGPAMAAPNSQAAYSVPLLEAIPLTIRVALAAAIVTAGAMRDQRWTVPVGAFLALPGMWIGGMVLLLVAAVMLIRDWNARWISPLVQSPHATARRPHASLDRR